MIKINLPKKSTTDKPPTFGGLNQGDTFIYEKEVFIKDDNDSAMLIDGGECCDLAENEYIVEVDLTIDVTFTK